jgi:hypothetical protein
MMTITRQTLLNSLVYSNSTEFRVEYALLALFLKSATSLHNSILLLLTADITSRGHQASDRRLTSRKIHVSAKPWLARSCRCFKSWTKIVKADIKDSLPSL